MRKKEQWRERRQSSKTLKVPRKESKEAKDPKEEKETSKESGKNLFFIFKVIIYGFYFFSDKMYLLLYKYF